MSLELVTWNIRGLRPLMQSNPANMSRREGAGPTIKKKAEVKPAREEAQLQLYGREDGKFWHPAIAFWNALITHSTGRTINKTAATTLVAQYVSPADEEFLLADPKSLGNAKVKYLTDKDWVVDTRRVVNKKAGAIVAARPKWRDWGGQLVFEVDTEAISPEMITQLLNIAGRFGIGCGRTDKTDSKWHSCQLGKFEADLK